MVKKKRVGKLHDAKAMFLRMAAGTAKDDNGVEYELSYNMDGTPIIRSGKSGKWWTLGWKKMLELAFADGIDE